MDNQYLDAEKCQENRFFALPKELKYKVFARLSAKDLSSARSVSKEWNHLLSYSTLQSLITPSSTNIIISRSFLVKIHGRNITSTGKYVTVDHDGRDQPLDMLNDLPFNGDWDVSCNGILVSFASMLTEHYILVCHPSLRIVKSVPWHSQNLFNYPPALRGVCFDPLTLHFSLLVGFKRLDYYETNLYSSSCQQWETIHYERDGIEVESNNCNAVFSDGYFFWMNIDSTIFAFSLVSKKFHRVPLPACPIHRNYEFPCLVAKLKSIDGVWVDSWNLKGCDGNLVLLHTFGDIDIVDIEGDGNLFAIAWRLMGNEEFGWKWQLLDFRLLQNAYSICTSFSLCETGKDGHWLWAGETWIKGKKDLVILDDKGELRQSFSILADSSAFVDRIWPFETNKLWDILA